ncbi:MAG: tetratricopeptide repeat protein, partial [Sediminibacterium sp.]
MKKKFDEALLACANKRVDEARRAISGIKQHIVMAEARSVVTIYLRRKLLTIVPEIENQAEYKEALSVTREKKPTKYKQYDTGMKHLVKKEGNLAWNEFLSVAESSGGLNNAFMLGEIKYFGLAGTVPNKAEALTWYLRAANSKEDGSLYNACDEEGILLANLIVAEMYSTGDGVSRNDQKASFYFERALTVRHPELSKVVKLIVESITWTHCEKFSKGLFQYMKSNFKEANKCFKEASKQSDARAECYLGIMYEKGENGSAPDLAKAVNLYSIAANRGYSEAMFHLGNCYQNGLGVIKSDTTAIEWYEKAAAQGCQSAQEALVSLKGKKPAVPSAPVPRVPRPASTTKLEKRASVNQVNAASINQRNSAMVEEFEETLVAAQNCNDPVVYYILGTFYETGFGTKIDKTQAEFWYSKALS